MGTILAVLDAGPAALPVLEVASGVGELMAADVEAVHVHDGTAETPRRLAERAGIPLRVLDGPVEEVLLDAIGEPDVVAAVLGARGLPGGRRPVGKTALALLQRAGKPLVVVPPEPAGAGPRHLERLLVPLEGTEQSSRPVLDCLCPLIAARGVELIVLHVFASGATLPVLDRPVRDSTIWTDEFLSRFCPSAARMEFRAGAVGELVSEVGREESVDLVVLSWSQDATADHAKVVRDVLGRSTVPVLLLPTSLRVRP